MSNAYAAYVRWSTQHHDSESDSDGQEEDEEEEEEEEEQQHLSDGDDDFVAAEFDGDGVVYAVASSDEQKTGRAPSALLPLPLLLSPSPRDEKQQSSDDEAPHKRSSSSSPSSSSSSSPPLPPLLLSPSPRDEKQQSSDDEAPHKRSSSSSPSSSSSSSPPLPPLLQPQRAQAAPGRRESDEQLKEEEHDEHDQMLATDRVPQRSSSSNSTASSSSSSSSATSQLTSSSISSSSSPSSSSSSSSSSSALKLADDVSLSRLSLSPSQAHVDDHSFYYEHEHGLLDDEELQLNSSSARPLPLPLPLLLNASSIASTTDSSSSTPLSSPLTPFAASAALVAASSHAQSAATVRSADEAQAAVSPVRVASASLRSPHGEEIEEEEERDAQQEREEENEEEEREEENEEEERAAEDEQDEEGEDEDDGASDAFARADSAGSLLPMFQLQLEQPSFLHSPDHRMHAITRMTPTPDRRSPSPRDALPSSAPASQQQFQHPQFQTPSAFFASRSGRLGTLSGSRDRPVFSPSSSSSSSSSSSTSQPSASPASQRTHRRAATVSHTPLARARPAAASTPPMPVRASAKLISTPSHVSRRSFPTSVPASRAAFASSPSSPSSSSHSFSHPRTLSQSQPVSPRLSSVGASKRAVEQTPVSRRINRSLLFESPAAAPTAAQPQRREAEPLRVRQVEPGHHSLIAPQLRLHHCFVHFSVATHVTLEQVRAVVARVLELRRQRENESQGESLSSHVLHSSLHARSLSHQFTLYLRCDARSFQLLHWRTSIEQTLLLITNGSPVQMIDLGSAP